MELTAVDDDSGLSDIMCAEQFSDFAYLSNDISRTCLPSNDVDFNTVLPNSDVNYHAYLPTVNDGQLSDVLGSFNLQSSEEIILSCEDGDIALGNANAIGRDTSTVEHGPFASGESPNKSCDHVMYSSDSAIDSSDYVTSGSENPAGDTEHALLTSHHPLNISNTMLDATDGFQFSRNVTETIERGLDRSCGSLMDISNSDIFNPAHSSYPDSKQYAAYTNTPHDKRKLLTHLQKGLNEHVGNSGLLVSLGGEHGNYVTSNHVVVKCETAQHGAASTPATQHANKRMKLDIVTDSSACQSGISRFVQESNNNTTPWNQNVSVDTRQNMTMPHIKQEILSPNNKVNSLNGVSTHVITGTGKTRVSELVTHVTPVSGVMTNVVPKSEVITKESPESMVITKESPESMVTTKVSPGTKAQEESAIVKPVAVFPQMGKVQVPMRSILQVNVSKAGSVAFSSQQANKRTPQKVLIPQHKLVKVKSSTANVNQFGALRSGSKVQTVKYLIPVKLEPKTSSSSVVVPTLSVGGQGQIKSGTGHGQILETSAKNSLASLNASNALKRLQQQSTMRKIQPKFVVSNEGVGDGKGQTSLRSILAKPVLHTDSNPQAHVFPSNQPQPSRAQLVNDHSGAKPFKHVNLNHDNGQVDASSSQFKELSAAMESKAKQAQENKFTCVMCKKSFALNRILLRTGGLYMQGKPQYCINCWEVVRHENSP